MKNLEELINQYNHHYNAKATAKQARRYWRELVPELLEEVGATKYEMASAIKDGAKSWPEHGDDKDAIRYLQSSMLACQQGGLECIVMRYLLDMTASEARDKLSLGRTQYYRLENDQLYKFAVAIIPEIGEMLLVK